MTLFLTTLFFSKALSTSFLQSELAPPLAGVTAADLISKSFARYSTAISVQGTINLVQTARGHSVSISTELAFVRPNKFFLKQKQSSPPKSLLVTSDGNTFSYDPPEGIGLKRCVEYVRTPKLYQAVGDIWFAAQLSSPDPNPILLISIGRKPDLLRMTQVWNDFRIIGRKKHGEDWVNVIDGKYRVKPDALSTGKFELEITDLGDIRRYTLVEAYSLPNHPEVAPIEVTSDWTAELQIDGKPEERLFTVVQ